MCTFSLQSLSRCAPVAVAVFIFLAAAASAQDQLAPPESMATSALLKTTRSLLESRQLADAIPYLQEVVGRYSSMDGDEAVQTRATTLHQLGLCLLETGDYEQAAARLGEFVETYPQHESAPLSRFLILEAYAWQDDPAQMTQYIERLDASGGLDALLSVFGREEADVYRHAVLSLVIAYARTADFENMQRFLPYCDADARSDTGLNLALIEGGDRALDDEEYLTALYLYRTVQKTGDLLAGYNRRIEELEAELAAPPPWVPQRERDAQQAEREAEQERLVRLKAEREEMAGSNYDIDLMLRMARCFEGLNRYWPACLLYRHIYTEFPESEPAEQCRYSAFQSLAVLGEPARAIEEGTTYRAMYPDGRFRDEVSLGLMHQHLALDEEEPAARLGRELLAQTPIHRYLDQVNYLMGYIRFQQQNYDDALDFFQTAAREWPNRLYAEESIYWAGMCNLFLSRFDEAVTVFKDYLDNPAWPEKNFAEDVTYRLGMARFGLGDFAASEQTFRDFLTRFPESGLVSEACSMIGDLRGAEGDLDTAIEFYARARKTAVTSEQEAYALFQAARVYELQNEWLEIISLMETYLAERGETGELAEASLWMARAWNARGEEQKALDICCETVLRYGGNPQLASVDLLLQQLIKESGVDRGGAEYAQKVLARLADDRSAACGSEGSRVLCLRLTALFAEISPDGDDAQALLDEPSLDGFTPLPLLVRAREALRQGRPDEVDPVYDRFMEQFAGIDSAAQMANLKIRALIDAGRFGAALSLARESFETYSGYPDAGRTQKLMADALRNLKEYDAAIELYNEFLTVREWRGELTPQVIYWIGVCRAKQDRITEAFAYFQRVYVLYELYPEWMAKAYAASIDCLEKLGRQDEIVKTWREMVANPAIAATPEGQQAQQQLDRLQKEAP
jgi:TolA-binding protein